MDAKLNELQKIDNKVGTGAEATKGASVVVHYTGWLYAPAAADHKGTS
jgi:FKBP-type peptidyl-prolyl cis-trans isomerase FkpA